MSPTSTHNDIIIDPQGDFVLHCGSRIRVSSKALTLASPFFSRLIADPSTPITISGSHDAILVLLNLFHFNMDQVPGADVSIDVLNELAMVAKEWECVKALGPWPKVWMSQFTVQKWDEVKPRDWEKWALIGRVFNRLEISEAVLRDTADLLWNKMGDPEVLIFESLAKGPLQGLVDVADDEQDELHSLRSGGVENFKQNLQEFINKIYTRPPADICGSGQASCGALIAISLLQKFHAAGILQNPMANISLNSVPEIISAAQVQVLDGHTRCLEATEQMLHRLLHTRAAGNKTVFASAKTAGTEQASPKPKAPAVQEKLQNKLVDISTNQVIDKASVVRPASIENGAISQSKNPSLAGSPASENRNPSTQATVSSPPVSLTVAEIAHRRDLARKLYPHVDAITLRNIINNWNSTNESDATTYEAKHALAATLPSPHPENNNPNPISSIPAPANTPVTPPSPTDPVYAPVDWTPTERRELMAALADDPKTKAGIKFLRKHFGNRVPADRIVQALYKCGWDVERAKGQCEQLLEEVERVYEG